MNLLGRNLLRFLHMRSIRDKVIALMAVVSGLTLWSMLYGRSVFESVRRETTTTQIAFTQESLLLDISNRVHRTLAGSDQTEILDARIEEFESNLDTLSNSQSVGLSVSPRRSDESAPQLSSNGIGEVSRRWATYRNSVQQAIATNEELQQIFRTGVDSLGPWIATLQLLQGALESSSDDYEDHLYETEEIRRKTASLRDAAFRLMALSDPDEVDQAVLAMRLSREGIQERLLAFRDGSDDLELDPVEDAHAAKLIDEAVEQMLRIDQAFSTLCEKHSILADLMDLNEGTQVGLLERQRQLSRRSEELTTAKMERLGVIQQMSSLVIVLVVFVATLLILGQVIAPIQRTVKHVRDASEGRFTYRSTSNRSDEVGELNRYVSEMGDRISQVVSKIRGMADKLADVSHSIAAGNRSLAVKTDEQDHNLRTVTTTVNDFAHTVKRNAQNASGASKLVVDARDQAERGEDGAHRVVESIAGITHSSKQLEETLEIIDSIASQIRLLSLNAAVEAARAGQHGVSFGVVAEEVRALADRCAEAAHQINSLVSKNLDQATQSSGEVQRAAENLQEITRVVGSVDERMTEIASGCGEQSSGVDQILTAVSGIGQISEHNRQLVHQVSSDSSTMEGMAASLQELLSFFEVTGLGPDTPSESGVSASFPQDPATHPESERSQSRDTSQCPSLT